MITWQSIVAAAEIDGADQAETSSVVETVENYSSSTATSSINWFAGVSEWGYTVAVDSDVGWTSSAQTNLPYPDYENNSRIYELSGNRTGQYSEGESEESVAVTRGTLSGLLDEAPNELEASEAITQTITYDATTDWSAQPITYSSYQLTTSEIGGTTTSLGTGSATLYTTTLDEESSDVTIVSSYTEQTASIVTTNSQIEVPSWQPLAVETVLVTGQTLAERVSEFGLTAPATMDEADAVVVDEASQPLFFVAQAGTDSSGSFEPTFSTNTFSTARTTTVRSDGFGFDGFFLVASATRIGTSQVSGIPTATAAGTLTLGDSVDAVSQSTYSFPSQVSLSLAAESFLYTYYTTATREDYDRAKFVSTYSSDNSSTTSQASAPVSFSLMTSAAESSFHAAKNVPLAVRLSSGSGGGASYDSVGLLNAVSRHDSIAFLPVSRTTVNGSATSLQTSYTFYRNSYTSKSFGQTETEPQTSTYGTQGASTNEHYRKSSYSGVTILGGVDAGRAIVGAGGYVVRNATQTTSSHITSYHSTAWTAGSPTTAWQRKLTFQTTTEDGAPWYTSYSRNLSLVIDD